MSAGTRYRSGERDSQFKLYARMGAVTPCRNATCQEDSNEVVSSSNWLMRIPGQKKISGVYTPPPATVGAYPDYYSECYSSAFTKLGERYRAQVSDMLTALGEARETCHEIGAFAKKVSDAYDKGHKDLIKEIRSAVAGGGGSKASRAVSLGKLISEFWLSWSFGIQPTIADVRSAAETLAAIHDDVRRFRKVSANAAITSASNAAFSDFQSTPYTALQFKGNDRSSKHYSLKMGGTLYAQDMSLPGIGVRSGVAPQNVIPALWELMPYSWLIDYAINLGDLVGAYSNGYMHLSNAWLVTVKEASITRTVMPSPQAGIFTQLYATQAEVRSKKFQWSRTPAALIEMPGITLRSPPAITQALNAIAVGIQNIGNTPPTKPVFVPGHGWFK